jgi:transposase
MQYLENIKEFVKNKIVYCGIDIHEEHWSLCFICAGEMIEKIRIEGDSMKLFSHLKKVYGLASQVHCVYEAGYSGFALLRKLTSEGYKCSITPPNRVPQSKDKVKTDKRDATTLAKFLSVGLLKRVSVPPMSIEADRQIIRLRVSCQQKLTRVKCQIKSHLKLFDIKWPKEYGNKWTKRYLNWLSTLEFEEPNLRIVLDFYLQEYYFLRDRLADITRKIRKLSLSGSYHKHYKLLVVCKGIGLITAMTFLIELSDLSRFVSAEAFSSYLGMTPSQFSSGANVRLGHITREGNSHVRRVLVEASWTVRRYDATLNDKYNRIRAKGTNGKKAIVAVARSLALRMRRCILDEKPYVMGKIQ